MGCGEAPNMALTLRVTLGSCKGCVRERVWCKINKREEARKRMTIDSDDLKALADELELTPEEVEKYIHQIKKHKEYSKAYNARPEVQEKRKVYYAERAELMKKFRKLIREDPTLLEKAEGAE